MKFRAFTGQIPNFVGGFSGFSPTGVNNLWQIGTYRLTGTLNVGAAGESGPTGIWFKPDGTKLFLVGAALDRILAWDLTTAWDINTVTNPTSMTGALLDNAGVALSSITGIAFSNDGTKAFITDNVNNALYRYTLSTAWDISSLNGVNADQVNTTIYVGSANPSSIWVRSDGLMISTANTGTTVRISQWTTTVANDITSLSLFAQAGGGSTPVGAFWVADGTRLMYVQQGNDTIQVNTYSYPYTFLNPVVLGSRVVTTQDTTPQDVYFKDDGTVFYYLGSATDTIYQFTK